MRTPTHNRSHTCSRSRRGAFATVEFALSLSVIFIAVFSVIDMAFVLTGFATCNLIALQGCSQASKATSLNMALQVMANQTSQLMAGPLGKFSALTPVTGYAGTGSDLYITATNIYTNQTTTFGPNKLIPAVDTASNVYVCQTRANFQVKPPLDLSRIEFLAGVPGLSAPLTISSTWNRVLEHPQDFGATSATSGRPSISATTNQSVVATMPQIADWNYYYQPEFRLMPGQKVLVNVTPTVDANNASWTPIFDSTGAPVTIKKGQRLTVWSSKTALWQDQLANWVNETGDPNMFYNSLYVGALVGKIGTKGQVIDMGYGCVNYECTESGPLFLQFNDGSFSQNHGYQSPQVIVTN